MLKQATSLQKKVLEQKFPFYQLYFADEETHVSFVVFSYIFIDHDELELFFKDCNIEFSPLIDFSVENSGKRSFRIDGNLVSEEGVLKNLTDIFEDPQELDLFFKSLPKITADSFPPNIFS